MSKGLLKAAHDPRAAALVALAQVLDNKADSQAALSAVLTSPRLMPVDKRLCTELVYGVLRRLPQLESFCLRYLQKPEKLPDEMRLTLYSALYEAAFLRTPKRALVHSAVEHVRNRFGKGLAGVANAVLRNMLHDMNAFHNPSAVSFAHEDERTAFIHAAPLWLVQMWTNAYGRETARLLLKASGRNAPTGLRLNRARPGWQEARARILEAADPKHPITPAGPAGLAFSGPLPPDAKDLLLSDAAVRQSAAAYEILEAMRPAEWPLPIWDCCAGRGGKTLALLEQGIPVALASDPSAPRLQALEEERARLAPGAPAPLRVNTPAQEVFAHTGTTAGSPQEQFLSETAHATIGQTRLKTSPQAGFHCAATEHFQSENALDMRFGTILVDAPCSGLGTLARRPEIRLRRTEEDVVRLLRAQREILDAAAARLLPGGLLVYMTCTLNPAENQGQVADFLSRHPGSRLESEHATPPNSPLGEFFYAAGIRV